MNTYQAACTVRRYLIEKYALEGEPECNLPIAIGKKRAGELGWCFGTPTPQVIWEGAYDWPFEVSEAIYAGEIKTPGVWTEPATGFALSFYPLHPQR